MATRQFLIGLVLIGFGFLAGPVASAQVGTASAVDDAAAIRQVLHQQQTEWNRGDVVSFMRGYKDAPDTTFVGASVRKAYRVILDDYRKHYAGKEQMGRLTFSSIDVRLLPGSKGEVRYAIVTGYFHLDRHAHGEAAKDDGVFSLLWEKTSDGWKIILDHSS
jgi:ketosteroid isomerase-like protein